MAANVQGIKFGDKKQGGTVDWSVGRRKKGFWQRMGDELRNWGRSIDRTRLAADEEVKNWGRSIDRRLLQSEEFRKFSMFFDPYFQGEIEKRRMREAQNQQANAFAEAQIKLAEDQAKQVELRAKERKMQEEMAMRNAAFREQRRARRGGDSGRISRFGGIANRGSGGRASLLGGGFSPAGNGNQQQKSLLGM